MRHGALALAALTLAAPAAAQDGSEPSGTRTVESAQQFLADFYAQANARLTANGYVLEGSVVPDGTAGATRIAFEGALTAVSSPARCKTAISVQQAFKHRLGDEEPQIPIAENGGRLTVAIDWGAVYKLFLENDWIFHGSKIRETGAFNVHLATGGHDVVFVHRSKEAADRAAFAMQFLVEHCGFKSETGF